MDPRGLGQKREVGGGGVQGGADEARGSLGGRRGNRGLWLSSVNRLPTSRWSRFRGYLEGQCQSLTWRLGVCHSMACLTPRDPAHETATRSPEYLSNRPSGFRGLKSTASLDSAKKCGSAGMNIEYARSLTLACPKTVPPKAPAPLRRAQRLVASFERPLVRQASNMPEKMGVLDDRILRGGAFHGPVILMASIPSTCSPRSTRKSKESLACRPSLPRYGSRREAARRFFLPLCLRRDQR